MDKRVKISCKLIKLMHLKKLKFMHSRYKVSKIIADTSRLVQSEVLEDIVFS